MRTCRSKKTWYKKHKELPTKVAMDPFLQMLYYINRNGRIVVNKNGRWQVYAPGKKRANVC